MDKRSFLILILIVVSIMTCSGCKRVGEVVSKYIPLLSTFFSMETDEADADHFLNAVLDAVQRQDTDALRSQFAPCVIAQCDELEAQVDSLLAFLKGEIVSYQVRRGGPSVKEEIDHGIMVKRISVTYDIVTTEQSYRIAFLAVVKDTEHPENVGIYSLYCISDSLTDHEVPYEGGDRVGNWVLGIMIADFDQQNNHPVLSIADFL